jgi:hypothetical protein
LFSVILNTLIKVLRWRTLLGDAGQSVRFSSLLIALLTGQLLNALLPVRVGDVSRAIDIGIKGPGSAFTLGTIVLEKIIDLVALALISLVVLAFLPLPGWLGSSVISLSATTLLVFGLLVLFVLRVEQIDATLAKLIQLVPARSHQFLARQLQSGILSIKTLRQNRQRNWTTIWTFLVWVTAIATNQLVLLAFGIHLSILASCLLVAILLIGVSIPALPGGIGIFEYLCVLALGMFAVTPEVALAYALILHFMILLPMILVGPYFIFTGKNPFRHSETLPSVPSVLTK